MNMPYRDSRPARGIPAVHCGEDVNELGQLLAQRGIQGDLMVVGGAVMALAYNTGRLTTDIGGIFEPKAVIYEAARTVAASHPEVGENWLNDSVKSVFFGRDSNPVVVLDVPGIRVSVASTEYLLAMKVFAARVDRDDDDVTFLANQLGLATSDEVLDVVGQFYPAKRIEAKVQSYVQQLFGH